MASTLASDSKTTGRESRCESAAILDPEEIRQMSFTRGGIQSHIKDAIPRFTTPLKDNFENRSLWLRFGLALSLSDAAPQSALQAFSECMRIDPQDPLPAMLAAKLVLEALDDPEEGLVFINEAIRRFQKSTIPSTSEERLDDSASVDSSDCYRNFSPLLSKCYLLASIMHGYIYEREPESMKQFKKSNFKSSLHFLELASKTNNNDHLVFFHQALHDAKQKFFSSAIDNLRQAININPHHVPSLQLLILALSALKRYNEALILCESTLLEFEDNLLLLHIKCNLEQCLVETKGYKAALNTAQQILKCIRRLSASENGETQSDERPADNKPTTNLFADEACSYGGGLYSKRKHFPSGEMSVWLLVAEIFIKIGSISDAELCVDEGSKHANGALSPQIMFARGLIAKAKNNLIEAKSFFQSCLALSPRHAMALQQVAHVHYLLGNHPTAEKFLKDSIDIDSDNHKSWHYLSLVFIETNQHERAHECEKKAAALEENSPVVQLSAIPRLTLE